MKQETRELKKAEKEEKLAIRQRRAEERAMRRGFYMTGNFGINRPLFQTMARKLGLYRDQRPGKCTKFALIGEPYHPK